MSTVNNLHNVTLSNADINNSIVKDSSISADSIELKDTSIIGFDSGESYSGEDLRILLKHKDLMMKMARKFYPEEFV